MVGAAVEFAYHGRVSLDTARKADALPLIGGLQLLGMVEAGALVARWVAEHLDASVALRVCHMADHLEMADLGAKAKAYADRHFVEVATYADGADGWDGWLGLSAKAVKTC